MEPKELEKRALEARRMADIAKHVPIPPDQIEMFGDADEKKTFYEFQIPAMQQMLSQHSAYMAEVTSAWKIIRRLRMEALYWRQKFDNLTAIVESKTK